MGKWITLICLIKEQAQNIQSRTNTHQNKSVHDDNLKVFHVIGEITRSF